MRSRSLALFLLIGACQSPLPEGAEAWSLDGRPLFPPGLTETQRVRLSVDLVEATDRWKQDPTDLDAIVWYGRRTAYLGRYRDAVEIYTRGLVTHPDAVELYRHRGHRYISLRRFDDAVADLERAAELMQGQPDVVEPDGIPNAQNRPLGTLHFNVWYHLGLAHYLQDELEAAQRCYRHCLRVCLNDDTICATKHWLYMTLRRLGRDQEAAALLDSIEPGMHVIENHSYHRLLLMYKGELSPDDALGGDGSSGAAATYGVGNWLRLCGEEERGLRVLRDLVATVQWAAFGFIAAEADLHRLRT